MIWGLDEFIELESMDPGSVFGQLDLLCGECNCSYEAVYEEGNTLGYVCPNCGVCNVA